jgi:tetratricopeptide (TPR) repeat protein
VTLLAAARGLEMAVLRSHANGAKEPGAGAPVAARIACNYDAEMPDRCEEGQGALGQPKGRLSSILCLCLSLCIALIPFPIWTAAQAAPQPDSSSEAVLRLLQRGAQAMQAGKPAEAEEIFRQAVAAAPQIPDGYLGLGMAQMREGKPGEAEQSLTKAVEIDPRTPGAHMFLGIAQFQMNKLDKAVASLVEETRLQPDNAEALTWLGMAELAAGHPDQATGPLDHAAALSPKDPNILDYRARAHTQVAQECFRDLYNLDPGSWRVHRALAEMLAAAKRPEDAIAEYKAALVEQPGDPDLYEALGDQEQLAGQKADATSAYEQELKLNPHSPAALYNLGKMQVESGDPAVGVEDLEKAIQAQAPAAPAYYYLGVGLAKTEHYQEAADWLEKSVAAHPSDSIEQSDWYELIRVYQRLHRDQDAQHAQDELKRLKAAAPQAAAPAPSPQ